MLLSKPQAIIYILRNELVAYDRQGKTVREPLPIDTVDFLEVVDEHKYAAVATSLLADASLRGKKILLVLSEDVTFEKALQSDTDQYIQSAIDEYSDNLPIEVTKQHIIVFDRKKPPMVQLWATNSELFQLLADRLEGANCKVMACVPATFFDIHSNQTLDQDKRTFFFEKYKAKHSPDFLATK
jgi:hypothetical protein